MLVEFGKANLIDKARQQPDKVKMVLDKVKTEGLMPTLEAVFNKLEQPLPLGYCNVGVVEEIGEGVSGFTKGDRVISNGPHAEYVCVPQNLVAKIPDNVTSEEASFTVIASIGLQGIRLVQPTLGETVVVIGLGLIGLLTAQLLKANGCNVIGVDIDESKLALAKSFGITPVNGTQGDVVKFVESSTGGIGADGVIITASSKSNDIISQAAKMSRKRGRIVLVGVIGLDISRADFYEKELSFQVSCSYGPGRYDEEYEQKGRDYPLPFVRWTEKRNFSAILQALSSGSLSVKPLITEVVALENYQQIYGEMGKKNSIASLIRYPDKPKTIQHSIQLAPRSFKGQNGVVGIIGAGNFTKMTMLPILKKTEATLKTIASASGVSGTALAKKYGFHTTTTDYKSILNDEEVDLVMITTRHNLHAPQVVECLEAGKNVFVEKPLAISPEQLQQIVDAYSRQSNATIHVGFNRRFSPHSTALKKVLGTAPMNIIANMNAGFIPANVWIHDMQVGGGRIIGEACHFIDLCSYLTGSDVLAVCANSLGINPETNSDNVSILLRYANGSNAVINYFSNGSKSYAKERIEIFSQDRTAIIDNWVKTIAYGFKGFSGLKTSLDKGHSEQFGKLISNVKNAGQELIPFASLVNTTRASFAILESMRSGNWVNVKMN